MKVDQQDQLRAARQAERRAHQRAVARSEEIKNFAFWMMLLMNWIIVFEEAPYWFSWPIWGTCLLILVGHCDRR